MKLSKKVFLTAVFIFLTAVAVKPVFCADVYTIDPIHSTIEFSVKHLMVSEVKGQFTDYSGTVTYDPNDLQSSTADVEIKTDSINTLNDKRDEHLKGADFFDAENFKTITFKNAKFVKQADGIAITGDFTIKGVTKTVTLLAKIFGPVQNSMGGDSVIGLSGETAINRQDFHVSWNKTMDNGGMVIADEVKIQVNLEAHKKYSAAQN